MGFFLFGGNDLKSIFTTQTNPTTNDEEALTVCRNGINIL